MGVGVGTQAVRPGRSAFAHRVVSLARSSSFSTKSGAFWEVLTDEKELGCQHAAYDAGGRAFMLLRKPLYAIKLLTDERHQRGQTRPRMMLRPCVTEQRDRGEPVERTDRPVYLGNNLKVLVRH